MNIKQPSRKKAVITQVVGGYLNTAISITQGLLLLPIYFKFIDFATYGYWVTIGSIIAMLGIINFGIGNMVMQRISSSYAKHDFQAVADYFINSQFLYVLISIVLFIVGLVLSFGLQSILILDDAQLGLLRQAYLIALFTVALTVLNDSFKGFSQALLKPLFGVYSTIFSRIIGIVITLVLLYQNIGLLSIPLGLLVTEVLILCSNSIYVYYQYKKLNIKSYLQKNIILEYLHLSPHLFALMLGNTLSNKSHPMIITTLLGAEMTTAYAVTRKVVEIVQQIQNVFNSSIIGPFSHLVGEGNSEKIKKISLKVLSISFFMSLFTFGIYIAVNYQFVNLWIGKNIALSQGIIFSIGFGAILFTIVRLVRVQLLSLGKFKFASYVTLFEGVLFIVSSLILISFIGIIAIPISMILASAIALALLFIKLINLLKIKISKIFIYKTILLISSMSVYLLLFLTQENINSWIVFVYNSLISFFVIGLIIITIYFNNLKKILQGKE